MLKSLANSYSALRAHQHQVDVVAHNLANVNTIAFKEQQVSFRELSGRNLAERRLPASGGSARPLHSGRGVELSGVTSSAECGNLVYTGRNMEMAIDGEGYFRIIRPDGSHAFTRAGNFMLDAEGNLVTAGGLRLDFPAAGLNEETDWSMLEITADGELYAGIFPEAESGAQSSAAERVQLGVLSLYRFTNPQGLSHIGENLMLPSEASGPPLEGKPGEEGFGEIRQHFLEESNVDIGWQMVMLIRGQRALQASARAAISADELWTMTLNVQV